MRQYKYIGPTDLLDLVGKSTSRRLIQSETDVLSWIKQTGQQLDAEDQVIATFIVALDEKLWITDRHSEHIACADGKPILSAGEMTFQVTEAKVAASAVTNQSTGFCPEPESWISVAKALDKIGLNRPDSFTTNFQFRLCKACNSINIVKEDWFVCGVCDADLDENWNFQNK